MFKQPGLVEIRLPDWIEAFCQTFKATPDISARMRFVIEASRRNVLAGTGGPFAAAVFESGSGCLVSLGVNLVASQGLSMLHAEMVAISVAQRKLGSYDLGKDAFPHHELFCSTEPCAMCLGAIPWSGVRRVVTAALDSDARDIGFDEGPKPVCWSQPLEERGIEVLSGVERAAAADVLRYYKSCRGLIYNARDSTGSTD